MSQTGTSRRQFLKIVAAAAGTAVLSSVPSKWETPVVDVGMLPAHAQGLSGNGAIEGTISVPIVVQPIRTNSPAAPSVAVGTISPIVIPGVVGTPVINGTHRIAPYTISNVPAGTSYTVRANASICVPSSIDVSGVGVSAGVTTSGINFNFSNCGA